jgi:DNA-binding winged helix-turn-helix (wHTH) protein
MAVINPAKSDSYEFDSFRLDARRRLLLSRHTGQTIPLTTKAFDTLVYLVERAGNVVGKSVLLTAVWPNVRVEENSLSQCISALRRALGEDPSDHRFIVTAPGRGYRFIADVVIVEAPTRDETMAVATGRSTEQSATRSLAVLPFKPLSAPEKYESLTLGMTDALISRLGGLRGVTVCPLSSVRAYGAVHQDPTAAGEELCVDNVLDGSIQTAGDRIRVSARFVNVKDRRQLWADHFDQDFTNIFDIQDAIAERAAAALVDELTSGDRDRLRRRPTQNAQA